MARSPSTISKQLCRLSAPRQKAVPWAIRTGKEGAGGDAPKSEGPGMVDRKSAKPGAAGTVTING